MFTVEERTRALLMARGYSMNYMLELERKIGLESCRNRGDLIRTKQRIADNLVIIDTIVEEQDGAAR